MDYNIMHFIGFHLIPFYFKPFQTMNFFFHFMLCHSLNPNNQIMAVGYQFYSLDKMDRYVVQDILGFSVHSLLSLCWLIRLASS